MPAARPVGSAAWDRSSRTRDEYGPSFPPAHWCAKRHKPQSSSPITIRHALQENNECIHSAPLAKPSTSASRNNSVSLCRSSSCHLRFMRLFFSLERFRNRLWPLPRNEIWRPVILVPFSPRWSGSTSRSVARFGRNRLRPKPQFR